MIATNALLQRKTLSKIALSCFLISLPLSIRKVFFVFSPDGSGAFNEYTDISLYLSDITLSVLIIILILENKKELLSISWWKEMFHVEHLRLLITAPLFFLAWSGASIFWSKNCVLAVYALIKLFEGYLLYVIVLIFIVPRGTIGKVLGDLGQKCSTWNNSGIEGKREINMFHVEQSALVTLNNQSSSVSVPRGTFAQFLNLVKQKCSTWNTWRIIFFTMITLGFLEGFLSILQFISQSSLGMFFLKESIFSASQAGVAKIIIDQHVFIRPYGLFPHPNILGGFLGITILFTITYRLISGSELFHVEQSPIKSQNVPRGTLQNNRLWFFMASGLFKKMFHVEQSTFIYGAVLFIQTIGFLLTFSKSAYIGLILATIYYLYRLFHIEQLGKIGISKKNVPRGTISNLWKLIREKCSTWNNKKVLSCFKRKMFHVEQFRYACWSALIAMVAILFFSKVDWYYFFIQPIRERFFLNHEFFSVMSQYPISGVGIGQSVFLMQGFFLEKLAFWQFQPVHSLYLLILVETGLVGFVLFGSLVYLLWNEVFSKNVPRGTWQEEALKIFLKATIIFVVTVSLFDHYFWDIQQGQFLLWFLLALLTSTKFPRY